VEVDRATVAGEGWDQRFGEPHTTPEGEIRNTNVFHHGVFVKKAHDPTDPTDPEVMIQWVFDNWGFMGILNSDKRDGIIQANGNRTLNVVRWGDMDIPNVYGKGVSGGKYLFFLITFAKLSGNTTIYYPLSQGSPIVLPNTSITAAGPRAIKHVCRVVGVWTCDREVPLTADKLPRSLKMRNPDHQNDGESAKYVPRLGHGVLEFYAPENATSSTCTKHYALPYKVATVVVNRKPEYEVAYDCDVNLTNYRACDTSLSVRMHA